MSGRTSGAPEWSAAAGRMRARDLDRVNARARLDAAYEEGQLENDEYHRRSERAQRARTVGELARLVEDLQPGKGGHTVTVPPVKKVRGGYPKGTRARDSDRAATGVLLDAALADGQLTADDHRTLAELASEAKTLGDLGELTDDLQRPVDAPAEARPPRSYRGPLYTVAALAVCALAFAGGFAAVHRSGDVPSGVAVAESGPVQPLVIKTPNLHTAEGISLFIEQYRAKFGDTLVDKLNLYDKYAIVTRPVAGQPNRQVRYDYRGGFDPDSAPVTRKTDEPTFDLAAVDVAALSKLLADAPATLRVQGGTISHVGFETEAVRTGRDTAMQSVVSVYVSNPAGESGFLEASPAGAILRSYPFKG
ncbi:DUF1707 SHOCT-like domain-containing protein [Nocardia yamanashiensis]|uniref:DUF1707 SHOCT-like domain-containing protein n=1 Tax=Nocardia yamanashiensis TaxID=209247 RepID=UPI001C3FE6A8|nr:DUF1707 domain-containing protein [Nocardia yamanashiensis]